MRTKQVIQQEIEALQKELEAAPEDFIHMPDGLYRAESLDFSNDPRFILKAGGKAVSFSANGGSLVASGIDEIKELINDNYYQNLKLLQAVDPTPIAKINVDWELIEVGSSMDSNCKQYVHELLKIARWARPLLEGNQNGS